MEIGSRRAVVVVSGGQTGVDRAALDAALDLGLPTAGWIPRGRWAENGPVPGHYPGLRETESPDPTERTIRNVRGADALLLVLPGSPPRGGTLLAFETALRIGLPVHALDLPATDAAVAEARDWLRSLPRPLRLNVAGPRESEVAGIQADATRVLRSVLATAQAAA
jgi:hypothetical protein